MGKGKIVQCRYCRNAYVNWDLNKAICLKRSEQMAGSKGECPFYESDRKPNYENQENDKS